MTFDDDEKPSVIAVIWEQIAGLFCTAALAGAAFGVMWLVLQFCHRVLGWGTD